MRFVGLILLALVAATAGALYLDAFLEDTVVVEVSSPSPAASSDEDTRAAAPVLPVPAVPAPAVPAPAEPLSADAASDPAKSDPDAVATPQPTPPAGAPETPPAEQRFAVVAPPATPPPSAERTTTSPAEQAPAVSPPGSLSAPVSPPLPPPAIGQTPAAAPSVLPADATPPAPPHPPDMRIARDAFGAAKTPAPLAARSIGFYSRGCLAGGKALPVDGPAWQAMRLSRNRNWGHPNLVRYVERLATDVKAKDNWPGLMVGDMSQPRGGPMTSGHASHQIGLDADIWFTPMPDRRLTPKEREDLAATDMLGSYKLSVDPAVWSEAQVRLLKRASSYPEVERILVHPAIKKAVCEQAGADREWLKKIRPYWGHHYHFHVRIACPPGSIGCTGQAPPPNDDGCGKELDDWFHLLSRPAKPAPPEPVTPAPPPHPLRVDQLPPDCRLVLDGREPLLKRLFKRSPAATKAAAKATAHHGALASPPKQAR